MRACKSTNANGDLLFDIDFLLCHFIEILGNSFVTSPGSYRNNRGQIAAFQSLPQEFANGNACINQY